MTVVTPAAGRTQDDLVAVLLDQHRALMQRTRELQASGVEQRERLVAEFATDLGRYGRTVQEHLDPLVRRYFPDGLARADQQLSEHGVVERMAAGLRRCRPGDPRFDELLGRLISQLRDHLAEQEHKMLPRVREHVPTEVLRQRGVLVTRARRPARRTLR